MVRRCAERDLPWRRDRGAYRILVSEVMLVQTTVAVVIPYFEPISGSISRRASAGGGRRE